MRVLSNEELTSRLEALEKAFLSSTKRAIDNTYTAESANSKADALTPTTFTKTAYIGDTDVVFTDIPSGNLTVFIDNMVAYNVSRDNGIVRVSFEPLEEVITVTLSIS